jgi:hypothetical protein
MTGELARTAGGMPIVQRDSQTAAIDDNGSSTKISKPEMQVRMGTVY